MEEYYNQWLCSLRGMTNQALLRGLAYFETSGAIYEAGRAELLKVFTEYQTGVIEASRKRLDSLEKLQMEYDRLEERHIHFVSQGHPFYPGRLLDIPDAPLGLYFKGELPGEETLSVAVIGARECSAYGQYVARGLGAFLGEKGVSVISGMARGIDGISQESALNAGGRSYGVLGSGVDICYPQSNLDLYRRLEHQGGLISSYPPGTKPIARNFPARNRIVSGLSDVVVVVEARAKSGTLITVDMALEQGKEVFTVPGRITDGLSGGCNRLIKQGAGLLLSFDDFYEEICALQGRLPNDSRRAVYAKLRQELKKPTKQAREKLPDIPGELHEIYGKLDFMPKDLETLQREMGSNYSLTEVQVQLMRLCMYGAATQVSPGSFCRQGK